MDRILVLFFKIGQQIELLALRTLFSKKTARERNNKRVNVGNEYLIQTKENLEHTLQIIVLKLVCSLPW